MEVAKLISIFRGMDFNVMVIDGDRCRLIIFDLDGTLVDTFEDITAAVNFALTRLGFPPRTTSQVRSCVGNGVRKLMERVVEDSKIPDSQSKSSNLLDSAVMFWMEYYRAHPADRAHIYAGVIETLKALRIRDIKTAVLSNKVHEITLRVLDEVGLTNFFDYILGASDTVPPKPSPAGVIFLMDNFGAKPSETWVIGDGEQDVRAGFWAGCHVCGVSYGILDRPKLKKLGVRCILDSLEVLLGCL